MPNVCWSSTFLTSCSNVAALAFHSRPAASSPSQEPPQAIAEAELPTSATREQNLQKWPNFSNFLQTSATSTIVVCVASVAVTLVIMATLGIRAFIECPKQISELAQRLIMTNSDFAKVLSECYEESSDLKQQLWNTTFNLMAAIKELKDMRRMVEDYTKLTVHLMGKLYLIQHVELKYNCTDLLEKAVQDLKYVYNRYNTVETGIKTLNIKSLRLKEVADNCANWLKQLKEEFLDLQTMNNSHVTLLMEKNQPRINNQNLQFYGKNYSALRTKIHYLREFTDNCTKDLREENSRLRTLYMCCTEDLKEEKLTLQTVQTTYATLSSEVERLNDTKHDLGRYLELIAKNRELKKQVEYHEKIVNELRRCQENVRVLQIMASFSSVWDYCDNRTFRCSPCMTDWVKHSSRCFFLSVDRKHWVAARGACVHLGGDMTVVSSLSDQKFLTTLVNKATANQHIAAWIGLNDMVVPDIYQWVNGSEVITAYWKKNTTQKRNGCVAIVAPAEIGEGNWIQSWNVLTCTNEQQYICETTALTDHASATTTEEFERHINGTD